MIELREYQINGANTALKILQENKIVYFCWEVRLGKTFTALQTADLYGAKKVLFLTKKLAIKSITSDFNELKPNFDITVINNESLHKITDNDFDLLISDEHHRCSAYPKPNKTAKMIKERFGNLPMIFLSGTPAIESGSQWFHSFWISNYSPFKQFYNFYKWAKIYVNPKIRYLGTLQIPDYSDAKTDFIMPLIEKYLLTYTQKEAGFVSEITENILYCEMLPKTESLIKKLIKDKVIKGKEELILGDTPVKLMSKVHQICNGTIKFESGESMILDASKAEFIKEYFKNKKIAIFYFFQKELEILQNIFGEILTTDLLEFDSTNKNIALQQVRGSEGISLKNAECLVYYNFGYSGKNYTQGRDRMTTKDREVNDVYFVLQKNDINDKILKVVKNKKRYSDKLFIKDFCK